MPKRLVLPPKSLFCPLLSEVMSPIAPAPMSKAISLRTEATAAAPIPVPTNTATPLFPEGTAPACAPVPTNTAIPLLMPATAAALIPVPMSTATPLPIAEAAMPILPKQKNKPFLKPRRLGFSSHCNVSNNPPACPAFPQDSRAESMRLVTNYFKFFLKKSAILSKGIFSKLSYRST